MPAPTPAFAKFVVQTASGLRSRGTAAEAWWTKTGVTNNNGLLTLASQMAQLRAQALGFGAVVIGVRISTYDANLVLISRLPIQNQLGAGWISPWMSPIIGPNPVATVQNALDGLALAAGRSSGTAIRFNYTDGGSSPATLPFVPFGATEERVVFAPQQPPAAYRTGLAGVQSPQFVLQTAVRNYSMFLANNAFGHLGIVAYTNPMQITGAGQDEGPLAGPRGGGLVYMTVPLTVAQVMALGYNVGDAITIKGRRGKRGMSFKQNADGGGHKTIAYILPNAITSSYTDIGINCTVSVNIRPCVQNQGYIAKAQRDLRQLTNILLLEVYRKRRSNRSTLSSPGTST